jgi:hypothetical protein
MNTNSVQDGRTVYFALENIYKKKASTCRRLEWSVLKFKKFNIEL